MRARRLITITLLPALLGLSACAGERGSRVRGCDAARTPCLLGGALVSLQTGKGEVRIALDGLAAPLTAGNFVELVNRGVYNGTVFHRVVREPVPFVVQGGDPGSADPRVPANRYGTGEYLEPRSGESRQIPLEIRLRNESAPRYGEVLTTAGITRQLSLAHQRGAVAMARSRHPDSASAQFYIALQALPELDGRYAVFGRVVQGMDVVDRIQRGDRLIKASLIEGGTLTQARP